MCERRRRVLADRAADYLWQGSALHERDARNAPLFSKCTVCSETDAHSVLSPLMVRIQLAQSCLEALRIRRLPLLTVQFGSVLPCQPNTPLDTTITLQSCPPESL
jgi:hypothetical protein